MTSGPPVSAPPSRPRVVQTDVDLFPLPLAVSEKFTAAGVEHIGVPTEANGQLRDAAQDADAVMVMAFSADRRFIEGLRRCRVIARCGVGIDNVDVGAAIERGIVVTHVPDFCTEEVAEHTLALILACERKLMVSADALRGGQWLMYRDVAPLRRLSSLTLGLVGFGRIARRVAALARPFGVRIIAHDPYVADTMLSEAGVISVSVDTLLREADILSLHQPLTPESANWLDADKITRLRPNVTVINTARGKLIDERALLDAVQRGSVGAAGLDVFDSEPPSAGGLTAHPNVLATPHSAAFSEEALAELLVSAADDVLRVLNGHSPRYPVNSDNGRGAW